MSRNLIDRDVLLEKAKQEQRFYKDEYDAMESGYLDEEREIVKEAYSTMTDCVSLINNAPIVDAVEVVHGKWEERYIEDANPLFRRRFYCSRCGNWTTYGKTLYCPNCGAKMDGERRDPCSSQDS